MLLATLKSCEVAADAVVHQDHIQHLLKWGLIRKRDRYERMRRKGKEEDCVYKMKYDNEHHVEFKLKSEERENVKFLNGEM